MYQLLQINIKIGNQSVKLVECGLEWREYLTKIIIKQSVQL